MADRFGTFHELHPDKVIVSMVRFHDKIIVATAWDIFELSPDEGRISPIQLKESYEQERK